MTRRAVDGKYWLKQELVNFTGAFLSFADRKPINDKTDLEVLKSVKSKLLTLLRGINQELRELEWKQSAKYHKLLIDIQDRLCRAEGLTNILALSEGDKLPPLPVYCPNCFESMEGSGTQDTELGEFIELLKCPLCGLQYSPSHDSVGY